MYDPRIGRFLSLDPLQTKYPHLTPYQFASNGPIKYIDLDGLEAHKHWYDYEFNDLVAWIGREDNSWKNIDRGEGPVGEKLKFVNYNFNLLGIVYFNGKTVITGKDDYGNPASRLDAAGNLIVTAIYHQAGTRLTAPSAAVKLESQLGKKAVATEVSTNEQAARVSNGNKEATQANTATQLQEVQQWQANAGSRRVPLSLKPYAPEQVRNGCEAIATKVQKSIGGEFLQITNPRGLQLGPIKYGGGSVDSWYHHVAVIKDGMVYDGLTGSGGLPLNKYKSMFEYADALKFEQVKKITVK